MPAVTWSQLMLMMTPPSSCAPSIAAACHDASIVPRRSTASSRSSFSTCGERGAGTGQDVGAGIVHPDVETPERLACCRRKAPSDAASVTSS